MKPFGSFRPERFFVAFLIERRSLIGQPINIRKRFSDPEWKELQAIDPELTKFLAASPWQDPDNFATVSTTISEIVSIFSTTETDDSKPSDVNRRALQRATWRIYKTFGPLNSAVNSKADYVTESGFGVYSDVYEINLFLQDLFCSYRNKLYQKVVGWMIRMLAECELFLLLSFDEEGNATIRALDPDRIGDESDMGLLVDPDDVTQTIFYQYQSATVKELIPDARFVLEPDYMKDRQKALGDKINPEQISKITKGNGEFKAIGGYRRFILHWKNLTGIHEYKRDTASLSTVIEWINLLIKHMRWESDHKRALSAYAWAIEFTDTPVGKVSYAIWSKMTDTEKNTTGLTKPITPGARVFLMPGMTLKCYNPQISAMSGSNQDLFNMAGASARTPQDLFQGQTAGSTYASVKSTRPPLEAEIENLQSKEEKFLRYEFLRVCFKAKLALGGTLVDAAGKKFKLPETYQYQWLNKIEKGVPKWKKINLELCSPEAVKFTFPTVRLLDRPNEQTSAFLGSKNTGLYGIGLSGETIAKKCGIDDLSREKRLQLLEEELYGKPSSAAEQEQIIEKGKTEPKKTDSKDSGE